MLPSCNDNRQLACFRFAKTKGQNKGRIRYNTYFLGSGKLYAGIFKRACHMVHRINYRLDTCIGHERKL